MNKAYEKGGLRRRRKRMKHNGADMVRGNVRLGGGKSFDHKDEVQERESI